MDYEDVPDNWRDVYDDRYGRELVDAALEQVKKYTDVDAFLAV